MWTDKARQLAGQSVKKKFAQIMSERIADYEKNPKLCKTCGKSLSYTQKKYTFCCHSCSVSHNNKGQQRNVSSGKYAVKPCAVCGNKTDNKKYCSAECWQEDCRKEQRAIIDKLGSIRSKKDKWFLIEKRGHRCERCKNSIWLGQPIPLDVHHKNGDSDDNVFENVELLCPTCHRLTPNHGSKNRNGSKTKRKIYRNNRYAAGLSY